MQQQSLLEQRQVMFAYIIRYSTTNKLFFPATLSTSYENLQFS